MNSGIYQIRNLVNGKRYVGSAVSLRARFGCHKRDLRKEEHHSFKLQRAWNRYGESNFTFETLMLCSREMLLFYEQRALDGLKPEYNVARIAGSRAGVKHSGETIAKLKGHPVSDETRIKIAAGNLGRKHSEESKAKMAEAKRNRIVTDETKARLSKALKGKKLPEDVRLKMSIAKRGKKRPAEVVAKIIATKKAKASLQLTNKEKHNV